MDCGLQIASLHGLFGFIATLLYYLIPALLVLCLWKFARFKPSSGALYFCGLWVLTGVVVSVFPALNLIWWLVGGLLFAAILLDGIVLLRVPSIEVERKLPSRFAINVDGEVVVRLSNRSHRSIRVRFFDGLPSVAVAESLPWRGVVPGKGYTEIRYCLRFCERGQWDVDAGHLEYSSFIGLWTRNMRVGEIEQTRVYPDYEPVVKFALLAMSNQPEHMGIVMKNRVGMSKDFHQLREYQYGDTLSKVDWKASSKKLQLISRDYQEQRDQNVILVVDCGQRMRAFDGGISQFDHCLNAMLLLAYVALRQGDNVGVLAMGGEERWLPPVKGVHSMTTVLNHLYDYQTSPSPSDYAEGVERLLVRQRRRSLVVFLTNIRGEDGEDLIEPLQLVRRKHPVILANLREKEIVDRMETQVESLDDALAVGASQLYMDERRKVLNELGSHGITAIDETAERMPVALANGYMRVREMV
jgi:uncharacterized protein (DUF58 family)